MIFLFMYGYTDAFADHTKAMPFYHNPHWAAEFTIKNERVIAINGVPIPVKTKVIDDYIDYDDNDYSEQEQFNLGMKYAYGAEKDSVRAFIFFGLAAKRGHTYAKYELGNCYLRGIGTLKDFLKAAKIYNNINPFKLIQDLNIEDIGIAKTLQKAIEFYQMADELSLYYNMHRFENYDYLYSDAAQLFRVVANGMLNKALYAFNTRLNTRFDFINSSQRYAIPQFLTTSAQFLLGKCYMHGIDIEMDITKALELYEIAAKNQYAEALYELGNYYERGIDAQLDANKAIKYHQLAAQYGCDKAKLRLETDYCALKSHQVTTLPRTKE